MLRREHERWKDVMHESDAKVWQKIDWKGNMSKEKKQQPEIEELALHFEKLYSLNDNEQDKNIYELETNVFDPQLDNPITKEELDTVVNGLKKGGYDYSVNVIKVLRRVMYPILLLFFNIMFFVEYPKTLARSLLTAIPKKGDLSLPINYRGVQMLAALGALYDHIIANRLRQWLCNKISYVQSAFQKGKSTLHQIFTIRLLIEIVKCEDATLYIGFFDLEKAFDRVSRYLLLKKLIKLGIGSCMLRALKRIYLYTSCIVSSGSEYSDEFRTYTGRCCIFSLHFYWIHGLTNSIS